MTRQTWKRVGLLAWLCALTSSLFLLVEQFRVSGPELLANSGFTDGLAGWEIVSGGESVSLLDQGVRLDAHEAGKIILLRQSVPAPAAGSWVQLSARLKTENVIRGEHGWQEAQLLLMQTGAPGDTIPKQPQVAASLHGTREWKYHDVAVRISPQATRLHVLVILSRASGSFSVRELNLTPVVEIQSFALLRVTAWMIWAAALLWVAAPLFNTRELSSRRVVFLAVLAGTVIATLMPASVVDTIMNNLPALFSWATNEQPSRQAVELASGHLEPPAHELAGVHISIYKLGHLIAFMLVGLMAAADRKWALRYRDVIILGLLLACMTEVLQFLLDGRTPAFRDVAIDTAGLLAGLFLWKLTGLFRRAHW